MAKVTPNVLFIFPEFRNSSFWNYRVVCEMIGTKYTAPPLSLITVAALLPKSWPVRLVDMNVEALEEEALDWADVVMTGGMLPQQLATLETIENCEARGIPTVVGGPDVTTSPDLYISASFRVLGEAEEIIGELIEAIENGESGGLLEAPKFTADVKRTPIPRYDLLNFKYYKEIGVQFSRGCPFTCEFCDIIEIYGRLPRAKGIDQMLAELQTLYDLGYRGHIDFVDDNLIGNKKAVKLFLPHLIKWQKERKYPFEFTTEASLNLAEDKDLLEMLKQASFFAIFVGVESPDEEVLNATRKKQNTRRDIAESITTLYRSGIFTVCGFIVGFDNEKKNVSEGIIKLIEEAAIPVAMVGLLYALPSTQLTKRLEKEGRLLNETSAEAIKSGMGDQCTAGLNFITLRPRADILREYRDIVHAIYAPEAFFGRIKRLAMQLDMSGPQGDMFNGFLTVDLKQMARLFYSILTTKSSWRGYFWRTLFYCVLRRPKSIKPVLTNMALYAHFGPFSEYVVAEIDRQIAELTPGGDGQQPGIAAQ